MALAGFEGCSIGHKYPTDPDVLRSALQLRGLAVSEPWTSTYFTLNDMTDITLQRFQQTLEFIKSLGGTDMVVTGSSTSCPSCRGWPTSTSRAGWSSKPSRIRARLRRWSTRARRAATCTACWAGERDRNDDRGSGQPDLLQLLHVHRRPASGRP